MAMATRGPANTNVVRQSESQRKPTQSRIVVSLRRFDRSTGMRVTVCLSQEPPVLKSRGAVLVITEYPSAIDKQGDFAVGLIDRSRSLVRRDDGSLPEPGQRHAGKSFCRVRWDQRRTKGILLK